MAKGSYFSKHKALIHGTDQERTKQAALPPIPEEKKAEFESGKVLLIDKDLHWTSFDAVRKIRNAIKIKKVGHAGTLDPLATGLLIICTGKFTKKINEFMAQPKEYTAIFTLGATTPTYDLESEPENEKNISHITDSAIRAVLPQFIGEIQQVPPIYSAIKKDGVASYELARRGTAIELEPRPITIYSFEISHIELPHIHCKILCSTGTYIRSLAHDFGQALGVGAHLMQLRRTKIGAHDVQDAQTIQEFMAALHPDISDDKASAKKDN